MGETAYVEAIEKYYKAVILGDRRVPKPALRLGELP